MAVTAVSTSKQRQPTSGIGHLGGALIVTVSVICMGEIVRAGRYLNVLLALVVAIGPWLVEHATTGYAITSLLIGIVVLALAISRGPKTERYGEWDKTIALPATFGSGTASGAASVRKPMRW